MAAGAARRYGGLKQLAPVGPGGEAMMEFSLDDAFHAGFSKAVLVIRREFEAAFRTAFVDRAAACAPVEFAYQEIESGVPAQLLPCVRDKPWGTAHAVLCAETHVDRPFAVINADDYYGRQALVQMSETLQGIVSDAPTPLLTAAMVGYKLHNTLSDSGRVSRGICETDAQHWLQQVVERHAIARQGDGGGYQDAAGATQFIPGDATTSMNLWGLPAAIFAHLKREFERFVAISPSNASEFELPMIIQSLINQKQLRVRVAQTTERWCGMTYADDLPTVRERMSAAVDDGAYPKRFWQ